jgi:electron transfer flavoprotein beta subunit
MATIVRIDNLDLKIIVLVKQVPDTKNVTADAMKEDGTVNRGALPAIFNPEDLNALELALWLRDCYGGTVTVMTMGPPTAAEVLRESLYRGADRTILVSDRQFAGADTLATSYTLAKAVEKFGEFDLVLTGRQAIDGDTAQVGPQTAQKLGIPQVTYVQDFQYFDSAGRIIVRRDTEMGYEQVLLPRPALLTVTHSAAESRPASAKRLIRYKRAAVPFEVRTRITAECGETTGDLLDDRVREECGKLKREGLLIEQWGVGDLAVDPDRIGLAGSPTKVKKIETVVVQGGQTERIDATEAGIGDLVHRLIADHTLS